MSDVLSTDISSSSNIGDSIIQNHHSLINAVQNCNTQSLFKYTKGCYYFTDMKRMNDVLDIFVEENNKNKK